MVDLPDLPGAIRAALPAEAQAYVAALEAAVALLQQETAALRAEMVTLRTRVTELDARLGQNSTNSSRPPSSDPPGAKQAAPPAGSRRPGGQPGHPGHFRALLDADQVDAVVVCQPTQCAGCGARLPDAAGATDPADQRWQVTEIPPLAAVVTEYRLAARCCGHCGRLTRAPLPTGVAPEGVGPRLTAVVALLTGRYRLSKREATQCLDDLFGVAMAIGSVSALEQRMSAALEPVVAQAQAAVQQAPVANLDETGWREARRRVWLWTVVTATLTVFHINASRGGAVARRLLGTTWSGIVGSDRGTMYNWLNRDHRQVCWAHLKRDFQKLVDWGPGPRPLGEQLLAVEAQVFALWHRFRAGEFDRSALQAALAPVQTEMAQILADGAAHGHAVAQPVCRNLQTLWPALWTFASVEGVEPTNNAAEQALRPAVLWRKGSFGTHSPDGSRFVERMLTVAASCRQQRRSLLDLLVVAVTAHRAGTPPPSLIPAATAT
jgi:transposase